MSTKSGNVKDVNEKAKVIVDPDVERLARGQRIVGIQHADMAGSTMAALPKIRNRQDEEIDAVLEHVHVLGAHRSIFRPDKEDKTNIVTSFSEKIKVLSGEIGRTREYLRKSHVESALGDALEKAKGMHSNSVKQSVSDDGVFGSYRTRVMATTMLMSVLREFREDVERGTFTIDQEEAMSGVYPSARKRMNRALMKSRYSTEKGFVDEIVTALGDMSKNEKKSELHKLFLFMQEGALSARRSMQNSTSEKEKQEKSRLEQMYK